MCPELELWNALVNREMDTLSISNPAAYAFCKTKYPEAYLAMKECTSPERQEAISNACDVYNAAKRNRFEDRNQAAKQAFEAGEKAAAKFVPSAFHTRREARVSAMSNATSLPPMPPLYSRMLEPGQLRQLGLGDLSNQDEVQEAVDSAGSNLMPLGKPNDAVTHDALVKYWMKQNRIGSDAASAIVSQRHPGLCARMNPPRPTAPAPITSYPAPAATATTSSTPARPTVSIADAVSIGLRTFDDPQEMALARDAAGSVQNPNKRTVLQSLTGLWSGRDGTDLATSERKVISRHPNLKPSDYSGRVAVGT